jgi:hypothetical protein
MWVDPNHMHAAILAIVMLCLVSGIPMLKRWK